MDNINFPELPDYLRRKGEDEFFTHYIFYEHPKRYYKEGVCSCCGERTTVRYVPDGYPNGIRFYGDEELWYARHGTAGECNHCGAQVVYKAAGIAKGCTNLEETSNLVFFIPSEDKQTVYALCYVVLAQPHTSGRTHFHWYIKARYAFRKGECYTEIYPYMLYNYFGRYGEMLCTCGWRDVNAIQRSGDRPYEPWQGYMYNPAGYDLVNLDALDGTFLEYARPELFLRYSTRNRFNHKHFMKYLWWYCHYPSLEIPLRLDVFDPVFNAVYYEKKTHRDCNLNAHRPWEFFRLSKLDFNLWIKQKVDRWELLELMHKRKITGQKPLEHLFALHAACGRIHDLKRLCDYSDAYGFGTKDWLKYVRRQGNISLWFDYMSLIERDKSVTKINPFPKDVKAAHDDLVRKREAKTRRDYLRSFNSEIKALEKAFPSIPKIYEKIRDKYEFEDDIYKIVAPKNVRAIIMESAKLGLCSKKGDRYIERIAVHQSYIFFLRRKKAPNQPYYVLEIEPDGTLLQERTLNHKKNKDFEDALPFIHAWQKRVAVRLSEEDLERAQISRIARQQNYEMLRKAKTTIFGTDTLLVDVFESDLIENKEVKIG